MGEGLVGHLPLCVPRANVYTFWNGNLGEFLDMFPCLLQHFLGGVHKATVRVEGLLTLGALEG